MARATSSLPVPLSPRISTVLRRSGDFLGQRKNLLHARILGDDVVVTILAVQFLAQNRILALQLLEFEDARNQHRDFLRIAGLHDVFLRAFLHGLDGGVHRA